MIALCLTGTLSACPEKDDSKSDGGARADAGQKDSGTTPGKDAAPSEEEDAGASQDAGTKIDAGADASTDSGTDAGTKTDASTDAGKADAAPTSGNAPSLDSAQARQAGRFGTDLRIDVTGSDPDGDTGTVVVSMFDKSNKPILIDSDGDGKADSPSTQLSLATALGTGAAAKSYVVIRDLFTTSVSVGRVELTLIDATNLKSSAVSADVSAQPVLAAAALCDSTYVENRCGDGYGCKGTVPATCQLGEAPKLTRVAYLSDDLGTRVLIEGTDADLDVRKYTVEFLNAGGSPVSIDLDGDDSPDANNLEREATFTWDEGKFFLRLDQGEVFAEQVAKVRVKVTDRGNQASAAITADKAVTPSRSAGQTCDPRSFDRCAANTVCVSSNGKTYSCTGLSSARTKACSAALVLEPAKGITTVRGNVAAPSLWDSPAGCVGGDPANQNESLVKLILAAPATKVTLSTNNAFTAFDSALYAIAKCEDAPVLAWCVDDSLDHKSGAELVLNNLPAGSYFVVVDSFRVDIAGSSWQLDVKVE